MIQDIHPSVFKNAFQSLEIEDHDIVMVFDEDGKVFAHEEKDGLSFLSGSEVKALPVIYLFSIDDERYFLAMEAPDMKKEGWDYYSLRGLTSVAPQKTVFAVFTAYHLWRWYTDNKFCGRCSQRLGFHEKERALKCPNCGNTVYPRINPAVIVGVIKDDRLLITKYRTGYAHSALIAGFTEIGETLEETVEREVMEETGIKVKKIRYYKSQPWGMAEDILAGFFCEADGDSDIRMDESELKYAAWVKREDIELQPDNISLTNEMMIKFKENKI